MTASTTAAGQAAACASKFLAMLALDRASGWTSIPAGIRDLDALRRHTDVGYYLTEAVPYDGEECTCLKNRGLIPAHAPGCLMTAPANRATWQRWLAAQAATEKELDRRLAGGELDRTPAAALVRRLRRWSRWRPGA